MYWLEYRLDTQGRQVLTGLTHEETLEFKALDDALPTTAEELRWLELFNRHEHTRSLPEIHAPNSEVT